jgi:predicted transcriptional regulator
LAIGYKYKGAVMAKVQDVLSRDFVEFSPSDSIADVVEKLRSVKYGVVVCPELPFPSLVTTDIINRIQGKNTVGELASQLPSLTPVLSEDNLQAVVLSIASDIISNPWVVGLTVSDGDGKVIGVVPRRDLARTAAQILERGGDTSRLEGSSVTAGARFYCPIDNEERIIVYYNPASPPRCSNGHVMKRKPRQR